MIHITHMENNKYTTTICFYKVKKRITLYIKRLNQKIDTFSKKKFSHFKKMNTKKT